MKRASQAITALFLAVSTGCTPSGKDNTDSVDSTPTDSPTDSPTETNTPTDQAPLVLLITVDTLTSDFLGTAHAEWNTSPKLDALFAQSTVIPNVIAPRGHTLVSMVTMLTGQQPRSHGIRKNADGWDGSTSSVLTLLQADGWRTFGYSTNMCMAIDYGVDERLCAHPSEMDGLVDQPSTDTLLTNALLEQLLTRDTSIPTFAWLHLMDPHDPYDAIEPYYSTFHPEPYEGTLPQAHLSESPVLSRKILEDGLTDKDRRHLHAIYASQVRDTDARIGAFLDALQEADMLEPATVVFGVDHGDELGLTTSYPYHGCSVRNSVLSTTWSFSGKDVQQGVRIEGWANMADIAPTLMNLAGSSLPEGRDGRSLIEHLQTGTPITTPAFFERTTETAGVLLGDHKYLLNPPGVFNRCSPYSNAEKSYPTDTVELFNLALDPYEKNNLSEEPSTTKDALHTALCAYLTQSTWSTEEEDASLELLQLCTSSE